MVEIRANLCPARASLVWPLVSQTSGHVSLCPPADVEIIMVPHEIWANIWTSLMPVLSWPLVKGLGVCKCVCVCAMFSNKCRNWYATCNRSYFPTPPCPSGVRPVLDHWSMWQVDINCCVFEFGVLFSTNVEIMVPHEIGAYDQLHLCPSCFDHWSRGPSGY